MRTELDLKMGRTPIVFNKIKKFRENDEEVWCSCDSMTRKIIAKCQSC